MSDSKTPADGFSEHQVEDILRRAIHIEMGRQSTLGVTEIKDIALQIGVSPESVDEAVIQSTSDPVDSREVSRVAFSWRWMLAGSAITILSTESAFPMTARGIGGHSGAVLLAAIALTAFARGNRPIREYLAKNASLWLGSVIGLLPMMMFTMAVMPDRLGDFARAILIGTTTSVVQTSVFGSALVYLAKGWKKNRSSVAGAGGGDGLIRELKRQLATKLEKWIDVYLKRIRIVSLPEMVGVPRPIAVQAAELTPDN